MLDQERNSIAYTHTYPLNPVIDCSSPSILRPSNSARAAVGQREGRTCTGSSTGAPTEAASKDMVGKLKSEVGFCSTRPSELALLLASDEL